MLSCVVALARVLLFCVGLVIVCFGGFDGVAVLVLCLCWRCVLVRLLVLSVVVVRC